MALPRGTRDEIRKRLRRFNVIAVKWAYIEEITLDEANMD